jgi:hypothetical protein
MPFSGDALLIDGQLFSSLLPGDLRDLLAPPRGSGEAEKETYEAKFNLRARWRMARHVAPDATAPPGGVARSARGSCAPVSSAAR